MGHGNPNQKKLVEQIRWMGFHVMVKRNQIHVKEIDRFPEFKKKWSLEYGEEGMTKQVAREFLKLNGQLPIA